MTPLALESVAKPASEGSALDSTMPWLTAALNPALASGEITKSIAEETDPSIAVKVLAARLVRHKTGRRCLIEFDVEITAGGEARREILMGKSRAKGLDRKTFDFVRRLRSNGFDDYSPDGISVPEPVATVPAFAMWLSRKVEGIPGNVAAAGSVGPSAGARMAEAAYKIHGARISDGNHHTVDRELEILESRLSDTAGRHREWGTRISALILQCRSTGMLIRERPVTGIHRDFYADQMLFDGKRVHVVDFDLHCHGDPALDVGNALAHLTEQALRSAGNPNALDEVRETLRDRYIELAGPSHRSAIEAYELFSLARHISISDLRPDRSQFSEEILRLCERLGRRLAKG